jgi:hypothetical protein
MYVISLPPDQTALEIFPDHLSRRPLSPTVKILGIGYSSWYSSLLIILLVAGKNAVTHPECPVTRPAFGRLDR